MINRGKLLVVDPIPTNRVVLRSILTTAGYSVALAETTDQAMVQVRQHAPDVILANTSHQTEAVAHFFARVGMVPKAPMILALTADTMEARVRAFDAGADDVISRPIDQALLLARMRDLMRVRRSLMLEEMFLMTGNGLSEGAALYTPPLRIGVLCDDPDRGRAIRNGLIRIAGGECDRLPVCDLPDRKTLGRYDAFVLVPNAQCDPAEILERVQQTRTSQVGKAAVLIVAVCDCPAPLVAALLDAGADDVIDGLRDVEETARRIKARLSNRRSIPISCRDALTGLPNARYALPVLNRQVSLAARKDDVFAVLVAELNDVGTLTARHGAAQAEAVMAEVAARLRTNLPADVLLARLTETEFLVLLPGAGGAAARRTALRLCHAVSDSPCGLPGTQASIAARLSVGVALSYIAFTGTAICRTEQLIQHARLAAAAAHQDPSEAPVLFGRPAA